MAEKQEPKQKTQPKKGAPADAEVVTTAATRLNEPAGEVAGDLGVSTDGVLERDVLPLEMRFELVEVHWYSPPVSLAPADTFSRHRWTEVRQPQLSTATDS